MIYFLIPLFNEEGNIVELAANLKNVAAMPKHFVLVNDCSSDGTVEMIHQNFESGCYTLLTNSARSGPGFSFNVGFEYILQNSKTDSDIIVSMEGDNTSDITLAPLMISLVENWNFDLVLSSVYAQGGGFSKTSFFRKFISFIANQVLRVVFDIKVLTLSSFYRAHSVALIRRIKLKNEIIVSEKGFICALEVLVKAIHAGAKIIEVPMMLHSSKRKGKSKMKIFNTSVEYLKYLAKQIFKN